jgi:hypothetical protein
VRGKQERGVARRGMRRAATLLWATSVPACDQKINGDASRCMSRPRLECTAGEAWNRPAVCWALVRPAGARREEGPTSRRPLDGAWLRETGPQTVQPP